MSLSTMGFEIVIVMSTLSTRNKETGFRVHLMVVKTKIYFNSWQAKCYKFKLLASTFKSATSNGTIDDLVIKFSK